MNWKEIISRFTMVLFAAGFGAIGTLLVFAGRSLLGDAARLSLPFFAAAAFLYLIGGIFFCFAFMPTQDTRRGPPRGFVAVNAVFDWFWKAVEAFFSNM